MRFSIPTAVLLAAFVGAGAGEPARAAQGESAAGPGASASAPREDAATAAAELVRSGRKLLDAGALERVHDSARRSLALAPSAAAWALEGDAFQADGNCPEALKAYGEALKLDPQDPAATAGREACRR